MEKENFLCGYCRTVDGSRTVCVITENGKLMEVDCCFQTCSYAANCTIAKQIEELAD